jgi:hypothetical protein
VTTTVHIDHAAIQRLLTSPDGIVGRDILRRTLRVHRRARELAPVRRGTLRRSIFYRLESDSRGVVGYVGSALPYALVVHQGSRPHMIYPRARRALYWPRAAHPVLRVRHPGTRGRPYLVEALIAAR